MKSGDLRRYVAIQENQQAESAFGDKGPANWVTIAWVWASIEGSTARKYESEDAIRSGATHTIRMRFYEGFKASYRIVDEDQIFEVLGFWNVDQRERETRVIARIGTSNG